MSQPRSAAGPKPAQDRVAGRCPCLPRSLSPPIGLALVALASVGLHTDWQAPPRFDGADYAALAESLRTGHGYRAIDRPDAPRHAHFPPGYPVVLAALWALTGPSVLAAHALAVGCTVGAVVLFASWLRVREPARVGLLLALALAGNWSWGRLGGTIQSEPLFLLVSGALLVARDRAARFGLAGWLGLGLLAAACVLTRHVGVMLAAAIGIDLFLEKGLRPLAAYSLALGLGVLPWALWLLSVREGTQLGLLPRQGVLSLIPDQAAFYVQRIPDLITGPFVEVATVFRPRWRPLGLAWAALATATVLVGLVLTLRTPRLRLAGLTGLLTLALLLGWPFQEAGRFLIPLVPFLLIGAHQTLRRAFARAPAGDRACGRVTPAERAAGVLLALSLPYSLYGLAVRRTGELTTGPARLDAACRWIAQHAERAGPVLARQGAEAYWLMGRVRTVVPPPERQGGETIESLVRRFGVVYLIDDGNRYARSEPSPVARFVAESPDRVRPVWRAESITVYEVRDAVGRSPG